MNERKATISPLEYRTDDTEYLFTFYSEKWSELVDLLANPAAYMSNLPSAAAKDLWIPKPPIPSGWALNIPVTASIQCGWNDIESIGKLCYFQPSFAPQAFVQSTVNKALGLTARAWTDGRNLSIDFITEAFALVQQVGGAFFAEFAWKTGMLTISYFPPKAPTQSTYPKEAGFSKAVLCRFAGLISHGTLHFDLDQGTSTDPLTILRAKFIVAHIENGDGMCARLNTVPLIFTNPVLADENKQIAAPAKGVAQDPAKPQIKFRMPIVDKTQPWLGYPSVVAESLSAGGPCMPCTMAPVYEDPSDPTTYVLGSLGSKCYKS